MVTAKLEATARLSLDALGLVADAVFGDVHGPQKAVVLSAIGAEIYVGDTPADMAAAVLAGAHPVGVATGSFTARRAARGGRGRRSLVAHGVSGAVCRPGDVTLVT